MNCGRLSDVCAKSSMEAMPEILFSFGLVADVQYSDLVSARRIFVSDVQFYSWIETPQSQAGLPHLSFFEVMLLCQG